MAKLRRPLLFGATALRPDDTWHSFRVFHSHGLQTDILRLNTAFICARLDVAPFLMLLNGSVPLTQEFGSAFGFSVHVSASVILYGEITFRLFFGSVPLNGEIRSTWKIASDT